MNRITAVLRLCRIHNCVAIAALYVGSARLFSQGAPNRLLLTAAWFATAAFSYAYNDLVDISVDRVNHPTRPLPSGVLSTAFVRSFVVVLASSLVLTAFLLLTSSLLWPLAGIGGGILYSSVVRKNSALAANLLTSALVTLVPFSAASGQITSPLLAPVCALVFTIIFARELLKDLLDQAGDAGARRTGLLALPNRRFGTLLYVAALLVALAALITLMVLRTPSSVFLLFGLLTVVAIVSSLLLFIRARAIQPSALLLRVAAYLVVPLVVASSR